MHGKFDIFRSLLLVLADAQLPDGAGYSVGSFLSSSWQSVFYMCETLHCDLLICVVLQVNVYTTDFLYF